MAYGGLLCGRVTDCNTAEGIDGVTVSVTSRFEEKEVTTSRGGYFAMFLMTGTCDIAFNNSFYTSAALYNHEITMGKEVNICLKPLPEAPVIEQEKC